MKTRSRAGIWMGVCALLIALDRLSKAWASQVLRAQPGGEMVVWPGVFHFHYTQNTGAAFGMLSGLRWLNVALTFLFLLVMGVVIWRMRDCRGILPAGALVMAGGLSHLYDRLIGGGIVDFIEIDFVRFAIFNVADICICVGAVAFTLAYLLQDHRIRSERA